MRIRARLFLIATLLFSASIGASSAPVVSERSLADLRWKVSETAEGRFLAVPGERAFVGGYATPGLEVWTYPLQVLRHYHVSFRLEGDVSETEGASVLRSFENTATSETRIYSAPGFTVKEQVLVPVDLPGALIHYSVQASRPMLVTVHFIPSLNLMWPAAVGGQEIQWNTTHKAYVIAEPTQTFHGAILSAQIVAHDDVQNNTRNAEFERSLQFTMRVLPGVDPTATVSIAGASTAAENALIIAEKLPSEVQALEKAAHARYAGLCVVDVQTPDEAVNRALRWAQLSLEQAWVCNPQLGCGLVGGYGPSRGSRRPQYDWFFAGDELIAVDALLREGAYERAKDVLGFILRYQDKRTGMIWHELSQSAGFLDWAGRYPYMFVHVDISFDFLNSVLHYVQTTGDLTFVRDHWGDIQAAYEYCRSTLQPNDGLPRISSGKEGGDEQDPLSDELILSANWVQAAASFATLAEMTGHEQLVAEAKSASDHARRSIRPHYWDDARHVWISGHLRSGDPVEGLTSSTVGLLRLGLLSPEDTKTLLDRLASPAFLTSWGIRSTPSTAPNYDPDSYAKGSVWAVGTASAATALWTAERSSTAYSVWHALVPWSELDAPGHMHEVLAGNEFRPERESVPEQTWSSSAFLSTAFSGLLGLEINGLEHRVRFAPHIPIDWNTLEVNRLAVGHSSLSLHLTRSSRTWELDAEDTGTPVQLSVALELPAGIHIRDVTLNGRPIRLSELRSRGTGDLQLTCRPQQSTRMVIRLTADHAE